MNYKITKIIDRVYNISCDTHYDLAMLFCRYQEFYESPNTRFRGKHFEFLDFMEWYSKDKGGGCFAYPVHWGGFNIPSESIKKCLSGIRFDENKYDGAMINIMAEIQYEHGEGPRKFYLIGSDVENQHTLDHEMAHGMYYTIPAYKRAMNALVDKLDPTLYCKICEWLGETGYTRQVFADETQAYLSTGFGNGMKFAWKKAARPFIKLYQEYRDEATHSSFKS